jgi:hypothetical protein
MTAPKQFTNSAADDARIDAMARAAGSALRRPAPAHGFAGVKQARRKQQIARIGTLSAVILMVGAAGAAWKLNSSSSRTIVASNPDITSVSTVASTPTPTPAPTPTTTPAPTTTPTSTPLALPTAPEPGLLYAAVADPGMQQVIDVRTGAVLRTEPVDNALAEAWMLEEEFPPRVDNAAGTYRFELAELGSPNLDACFQPPLNIVELATGTLVASDARSFPSNAASNRVTPDGNDVIVAAAQCATGSEDVTTTILRFPADDLSAQGQVLTTVVVPRVHTSESAWVFDFDESGRFVLVSVFGIDVGGIRARVVTSLDLQTGQEVDVLGGCTPSIAPNLRTVAGEMSTVVPQEFLSGSTIAYTALCDDGLQHAVIVDVANPTSRIDMIIPGALPEERTTIELDRSGLTDPSTAWFVVRVTDSAEGNRRAFVGQGSVALRPLEGITDPTFLPMWSAGG